MSIAEDATSVVGAYYPAGVRGELPGVQSLSGRGVLGHRAELPAVGAASTLGKAFFDDALHHLPEALDFSRFR
jgi:hypothetical protein